MHNEKFVIVLLAISCWRYDRRI